jgi:hypothetical protein
MYDGSVNRAISVDSRGMLEVLKKVFDANHIAAELTSNQVSVKYLRYFNKTRMPRI